MNKETTTQDCQTLLDLMPAYSIGATDPDEEHFIKARLPDCPEALAELAAYMGVNDRLHTYGGPAQPPDRVLTNVLSRIEGSARPAPKPIRARRRLTVRISQIAALIAVVLLLGSNLYWLSRDAAWQRENDALISQLGDQRQFLAFVGTGGAQRIDVPTTIDANPDARATVICGPDETFGLLYVSGFPQLEAQTAYQIWLSNDQGRVSGGLFQVDHYGRGTVLFSSPAPMGSYKYIGVTIEPETGSDGPTGPRVMRGALYYSEPS